MSGKSTDSRFMVIFTIVGLICFFLASSAHSNVPKHCDSNLIRDGVTVIQIISAILATLGIAFIFCNFGLPFGSAGHDCYHAKQQDGDKTGEFFITVSLFISITMAAVSLAVAINIGKNSSCKGDDSKESKESKNNKDKGKKLAFYIWSMFSLYVIMSIMSLVGLWWNISYIPAWARGDKGKQKKKKKKSRTGFFNHLFGGGDDDDEDIQIE